MRARHAVLLLLVLAAPALAQTQADPAWCASPTATQDQKIAGCTLMIESGQMESGSSADLLPAYTHRAAVYDARKQYDLAIADYSRIIALKPDTVFALNARCWEEALAGQLQPALADCNRALALHPGDHHTLDSRGMVHLKMNNNTAALADYDAAVTAHPEDASFFYGRGIAKRRTGDAKGAQADIATARTMDARIAGDYAGWGITE